MTISKTAQEIINLAGLETLEQVSSKIKKLFRGKFLKIGIHKSGYFGYYLHCYLLPATWESIKHEFLKWSFENHHMVRYLNDDALFYLGKNDYNHGVTFRLYVSGYKID